MAQNASCPCFILRSSFSQWVWFNVFSLHHHRHYFGIQPDNWVIWGKHGVRRSLPSTTCNSLGESKTRAEELEGVTAGLRSTGRKSRYSQGRTSHSADERSGGGKAEARAGRARRVSKPAWRQRARADVGGENLAEKGGEAWSTGAPGP